MIQISVTLPKKLFQNKEWVEAMADSMKHNTAPTLKKLFRQSVYGWSDKPSFRQKFTRHAAELSMEVYTENDIYGLVNAGSPRHWIPKSGTTFQRFRKGYRPATRPGSLQSGRKYRSQPWWTAYRVDHPGFQARKFDELVAKEYEPQFRREITQSFATAAKRMFIP